MPSALDNPVFVLGNGDFPASGSALQAFLSPHSRLICCDGAINRLLASDLFQSHRPDAVVGDLDSISSASKKVLISNGIPIISAPSQEFNDLQKSIRWAEEQCWISAGTRVWLFGCTGGREDHTLANISLLADFYQRGIDCAMITDHGQFRPLGLHNRLKTDIGRQISIFSFEPDRKFTASGLKYPLIERSLPALWQGSLNEAIAEEIVIDVTEGNRAPIIFLADCTTA